MTAAQPPGPPGFLRQEPSVYITIIRIPPGTPWRLTNSSLRRGDGGRVDDASVLQEARPAASPGSAAAPWSRSPAGLCVDAVLEGVAPRLRTGRACPARKTTAAIFPMPLGARVWALTASSTSSSATLASRRSHSAPTGRAAGRDSPGSTSRTGMPYSPRRPGPAPRPGMPWPRRGPRRPGPSYRRRCRGPSANSRAMSRTLSYVLREARRKASRRARLQGRREWAQRRYPILSGACRRLRGDGRCSTVCPLSSP